MANSKKSNVQVFYRVIKAERGHPFSGLYAVEKVFFKDGALLKREIVHEWDLRIISESILAKLGGGDAYETFKLDKEIEALETEPNTTEADARTAEDLKNLTARKLQKELQMKPVKE
jgi:hypothetical protein